MQIDFLIVPRTKTNYENSVSKDFESYGKSDEYEQLYELAARKLDAVKTAFKNEGMKDVTDGFMHSKQKLQNFFGRNSTENQKSSVEFARVLQALVHFRANNQGVVLSDGNLPSEKAIFRLLLCMDKLCKEMESHVEKVFEKLVGDYVSKIAKFYKPIADNKDFLETISDNLCTINDIYIVIV